MQRDFDMLNTLSNNLFLFINSLADRLADSLGQSKSTILGNFLSSYFVCVIIVTTKEESKK